MSRQVKPSMSWNQDREGLRPSRGVLMLATSQQAVMIKSSGSLIWKSAVTLQRFGDIKQLFPVLAGIPKVPSYQWWKLGWIGDSVGYEHLRTNPLHPYR